MSDPTYPLFPLFSFFSALLVLLPFPWHLQAWNAGTCAYMLWTSFACLNGFINAVAWNGNVKNTTPVWCDISSRLMIGTAVAIPAATLCITRRLYKIATTSDVVVDSRGKKRAVFEDLSIAIGIPLAQMILQIVVSGHRFNILEDIGCFPATINVWLAYPLVTIWPLVIGLISTVYCVVTIRAFNRRDAQLKALFSPLASSTSSPFSSSPLSASQPRRPFSSLTSNRYFRLILLCVVSLALTTTLAGYTLFLNLTSTPIQPYRGWADLHWGYARVDRIPAVVWTGALRRDGMGEMVAVGVETSRWLGVVCAVVFFAFFGLAEEARKGYERVWETVKGLWGRVRGREIGPYGRHLVDLERGPRARTKLAPIQVMFVPPHEKCVTPPSPATLRSHLRTSNETLVNDPEDGKWKSSRRSPRRNLGRGHLSRPSLDAPVHVIGGL